MTNQIDIWTPNILPDVQPHLDLKVWSQEFRDVYQIAEALCKTPFVPREMLGKQADVAATIMKGRELGLDPFDALGSIYIVHGRVGFFAEFMRRRIIQAGHIFRIVESSDTKCVVEGVRKGGGEPQRASFSADQARKAGVDLGKYPADKLVARATSRLCRQAFPDVLSGTLIAEDIIDGLVPASPDEPTETVPARPVLKRGRPPRQAVAAHTQPPTQPAPPVTDDDDIFDETPPEQAPEPKKRKPRKTATVAEDAELAAIAAAGVEATIIEPEPEPADESGYDDTDTGDVLGFDDIPGDEPISGEQLKRMLILFRERGFTDDQREDRIAFCVGVIGRDITSSKDMTRGEASDVIDALQT